jgi:hypothetical protein
MGWRGFGFVHHSRTLFCRAVPNLSITIRNFFIAVLAWKRSPPRAPSGAGALGSAGSVEQPSYVGAAVVGEPGGGAGHRGQHESQTGAV